MQVVKDKHAGNRLKNKHLEQQFKELESKFDNILKEQMKSSSNYDKKAAAGAKD